jgi:hypothetical protein
MKSKITKTNFLKFASFAIIMFGVTAANAQSTANVARQIPKAVKVVDNKGTIKYFQSSNGITQIVNTLAGDVTTTTWQLGGTLTDNTYIDATGAAFALDGLALETGSASTGATTGSIHGTAAATAAAAAGWALLVRDEATGTTKKLLAENLVTGIRKEYTQVANATGAADITLAIAVVGLPDLSAPAAATTIAAKLFVFRNGIKLRSGVDFAATAGKVTITYNAADLAMYAGDVIEIQYIK